MKLKNNITIKLFLIKIKYNNIELLHIIIKR